MGKSLNLHAFPEEVILRKNTITTEAPQPDSIQIKAASEPAK